MLLSQLVMLRPIHGLKRPSADAALSEESCGEYRADR